MRIGTKKRLENILQDGPLTMPQIVDHFTDNPRQRGDFTRLFTDHTEVVGHLLDGTPLRGPK